MAISHNQAFYNPLSFYHAAVIISSKVPTTFWLQKMSPCKRKLVSFGVSSVAVIAMLCASVQASRASDNSKNTQVGGLSISCHELLKGRPDPYGATYSLRGDKLYREEVVISTEGGIVLSTIDGVIRSASHHFDGKKLTRTLFSQVGSHSKKAINVEVFDFENQKIIQDGEDTCYHNANFPKHK